jgi:hypothetical protein
MSKLALLEELKVYARRTAARHSLEKTKKKQLDLGGRDATTLRGIQPDNLMQKTSWCGAEVSKRVPLS